MTVEELVDELERQHAAVRALPPPVGPRGLAYRAALEGRLAGARGDAPSSCPYSRARGFTRRAWIAGYVHGRVDAGLPLPDPS